MSDREQLNSKTPPVCYVLVSAARNLCPCRSNASGVSLKEGQCEDPKEQCIKDSWDCGQSLLF